jgi:F-type H+-transporting ATPase subunit a
VSWFLAAAESPPGFHDLTPVCSNSHPYWNLIALNFYYCDVTTDTLANTALAVVVTLAIVFLITRRLNTGVPGKLQIVLEFLLFYAKGMVRESVAEDADFIVPIAATIGLYILVANWLDFIPISGLGLHPANSDLNQTLAMAIVVILVVQWYSVKVLGPWGYLRRFTKPFEMALPIRIAFIPLNIIEELVKPITLALRLFGNIFAGLMMVYLLGLWFSAGVDSGGVIGFVYVPLSTLFLVIWKAFDVFFVGTIQAFIFMLLTIIYFGMAREGIEEHGHGGHAPAAAAGERREPPATAPATTH